MMAPDLRPIDLSSIDLHCHSDYSDGALAPSALLGRAAERGVRMLALTDHDTVDGLEAAHTAARHHGIHLIPGVEISVTWNGRTLHVVGLDIDPSNRSLRRGLEEIRVGRLQRAESIGRRLTAIGFGRSFEGALALASTPQIVGRAHFARYLVASGAAVDTKTAFRRFLGEGRPGYVRHRWADLGDAVNWIREAGGVAVLAHPARYKLRVARLRALLEAFRALGGCAVEVVTARGQDAQAVQIASLARECGLLASAGSDFHSPDESWLDLGQVAELPPGCEPVWANWPVALSHD
jgi:predicted metal-dependent phosphoesterase TrpH